MDTPKLQPITNKVKHNSGNTNNSAQGNEVATGNNYGGSARFNNIGDGNNPYINGSDVSNHSFVSAEWVVMFIIIMIISSN